jgi:hypothetical protein
MKATKKMLAAFWDANPNNKPVEALEAALALIPEPSAPPVAPFQVTEAEWKRYLTRFWVTQEQARVHLNAILAERPPVAQGAMPTREAVLGALYDSRGTSHEATADRVLRLFAPQEAAAPVPVVVVDEGLAEKLAGIFCSDREPAPACIDDMLAALRAVLPERFVVGDSFDADCLEAAKRNGATLSAELAKRRARAEAAEKRTEELRAERNPYPAIAPDGWPYRDKYGSAKAECETLTYERDKARERADAAIARAEAAEKRVAELERQASDLTRALERQNFKLEAARAELAELRRGVEAYSDALREIASFLGNGGHNAPDPIDARDFVLKAKDGIDFEIKCATKRADERAASAKASADATERRWLHVMDRNSFLQKRNDELRNRISRLGGELRARGDGDKPTTPQGAAWDDAADKVCALLFDTAEAPTTAPIPPATEAAARPAVGAVVIGQVAEADMANHPCAPWHVAGRPGVMYRVRAGQAEVNRNAKDGWRPTELPPGLFWQRLPDADAPAPVASSGKGVEERVRTRVVRPAEFWLAKAKLEDGFDVQAGVPVPENVDDPHGIQALAKWLEPRMGESMHAKDTWTMLEILDLAGYAARDALKRSQGTP